MSENSFFREFIGFIHISLLIVGLLGTIIYHYASEKVLFLEKATYGKSAKQMHWLYLC